MPLDATGKTAELYRMAMPGHLCPFGLKTKDLLEREGYEAFRATRPNATD